MVFQIKRLDIPEPPRILEVGNHNIGPGQFLLTQESYPEVVHNHSQLVVTEDVVSIRTLNNNICYFMNNKTFKKETLLQSEAYNFNSGDRFGLTPDKYWYEITTCSELDASQNPLISSSTDGGDGNQKESGDIKNIISVSDTEDDSPTSCGSNDDSNKRASVPLSKEPEASSNESAGSTLAVSTALKRAQESKDASPIPIKKAKTESPSQDGQDAQTEPKKDNDCVCCP